MKIHLTKNEYRLLIEMLTMSEWVIHSHQLETSEEFKQHGNLFQKLLSYYKDFKCEDLVEHDKQDDKYYQTIIDDHQSPVNDLIKEYEDEVFWEELTNRLAKRDLINKHGRKKVSEMDPVERFEGISEMSEKYYEEFSEHGVSHLNIHKNQK